MLAIYISVRGLGLLRSAHGIVCQPERCKQLISQLLQSGGIDKRTDLVLAGAAVGKATQLGTAAPLAGVPPHLQANIDLSQGSPATVFDQKGYPLKGLHELQSVQDEARKAWNAPTTPQSPVGLCVLPVETHFTSTYNVEVPQQLDDSAAFDRYFTTAVQDEMQRLGGAFALLRSRRLVEQIVPYEEKPRNCVIANAHLWPLNSFTLPTAQQALCGPSGHDAGAALDPESARMLAGMVRSAEGL